MKINREDLLNRLNMVKPGLSGGREFLEQSSHFIFQQGQVLTFNDEIACSMDVDLGIEGAVHAPLLLDILGKLKDEDLEVRENAEGTQVQFKGESKGFAIAKEAQIFLPIDRVDMPGKWAKLPKNFLQSIGMVQHCISRDANQFALTCIHLHPDYIEATDYLQLMRCKLKTGLTEPVLSRGSSLGHVVSLGMDKISLTASFIHFANQAGLVFSCRRYDSKYPELGKHLVFKGHPMVIPKAMVEASECCEVFAKDNSGQPLIEVDLDGSIGQIRLTGTGLTGYYFETKKVDYKGPRLQFVIAPDLLRHVSSKYNHAELSEDKLKVTGDEEGSGWIYVTVLGKPGDQEEQGEEDVTEKPPEEEAEYQDALGAE